MNSIFRDLQTHETLFGGKCSWDQASQMSLVVKNPPANAEDIRDAGSIPVLGRFPGGGHGNPPSILAWRTPWAEEPGELQSIGLQRIRQD